MPNQVPHTARLNLSLPRDEFDEFLQAQQRRALRRAALTLTKVKEMWKRRTLTAHEAYDADQAIGRLCDWPSGYRRF